MLSAAVVPAALWGSTASAEASPIVGQDNTRRAFGAVLLIGDSTSSRRWRTLRRDLVARQLGPFRYDLQPGRSISTAEGWGYNAVEAVRAARRAGFDPPSFVVALGFPDLYVWEGNAHPVTTVPAAERLIAPLLSEIGPDRTVIMLNLHSRTPRGAAVFNTALDHLAVQNPNLLVSDWASLAADNEGWHLPDGYHYNVAGARARQQFLALTMVAAARRSSHRRSWHP